MSYKNTTKQLNISLTEALTHLREDDYFQAYIESVQQFRDKYFDEATNIRINLLDQAKCLGAAGALDEVLRVALYTKTNG
jgi:hypothetical protein